MACSKGHLEICEYLIKKGSNLNHKNKNGNIPIDTASTQTKNHILNFLKNNL